MDLRERRREATRVEITDAALTLVERHGFSATTVDDIAREAGVSPSTFFRHYATKEESVLHGDSLFEADLDRWLADAAPEDVTLAALENLFRRSFDRLAGESAAVRARLLRVRRLLADDAHLRSAAYAADAMAMCRLTDRVAEILGDSASRGYARLLVEVAGTTARVAYDVWAEAVDGGRTGAAADPVALYASATADLRRLVSELPD
ncbi:TetR/AcrR family transcriptional regulator [Rhodococcoides corynebacterioides]|uniref:TetR/AcrR family transcriptional regulator n=1 Tax=Rhodococcoides corynebacterioides TaxID=53972 RepID=UPI003AD9C908